MASGLTSARDLIGIASDWLREKVSGEAPYISILDSSILQAFMDCTRIIYLI